MAIHYIYQFPYHIVEQIWYWLDAKSKILVSKEFYFKYHHMLLSDNIITQKDNYIRNMIRNDYSFVFNLLINENIDMWLKNKQFLYKNINYSNYLQYLLDITTLYNAFGCRNLLLKELRLRDYDKNLSKKKRVRNLKWTN